MDVWGFLKGIRNPFSCDIDSEYVFPLTSKNKSMLYQEEEKNHEGHQSGKLLLELPVISIELTESGAMDLLQVVDY